MKPIAYLLFAALLVFLAWPYYRIYQIDDVLGYDDPEALAARVLRQEHRIYPRAVEWFAQGRLRLDAARVLLDGRPLERPALIEPEQASGAGPG